MYLHTPNIEKKPKSVRYYQEGVPENVCLQEWKLEIKNLDGSIRFVTLKDVLNLPQITEHRRMFCVCNWSIKRWWTGVLLSDVLSHMGVDMQQSKYLKQISIGTKNGHYDSTINLSDALERRAMLVHSVDGNPLIPEQGFPLRLIDFGIYGYKCIKGLQSLEFTNDFDIGYWEGKFGYSKEGSIVPKRYYFVDLQQKHFVPNYSEGSLL